MSQATKKKRLSFFVSRPSGLVCLSAALILLSGCAKMSHVRELSTLQALSNEQDAQARYVEEKQKKFALLLEKINSGEIEDYQTRRQLTGAFGEPVLAVKVIRDGKELDEWLYRDPVEYFKTAKVYFYLDSQGNVVSRDIVPASGK